MRVGNLKIRASGAAKRAANLPTQGKLQSAVDGASGGKENRGAPRSRVHTSEGCACLRCEAEQRCGISAEKLCARIQAMSGEIHHARPGHIRQIARHSSLRTRSGARRLWTYAVGQTVRSDCAVD